MKVVKGMIALQYILIPEPGISLRESTVLIPGIVGVSLAMN